MLSPFYELGNEMKWSVLVLGTGTRVPAMSKRAVGWVTFEVALTQFHRLGVTYTLYSTKNVDYFPFNSWFFLQRLRRLCSKFSII